VLDYATRNAEPLLSIAHIRDRASVATTPVASYGNRFFLKVCSGCGERVLLVQFQCFAESCPQAVQQFLMGGLLTIYSWDFFNPTDPARTNLFHHRCVVSSHRSILSRFGAIVRADFNAVATLKGGQEKASAIFVDVNEAERGLDQMMKGMRQKTRTK
jgi:hypothetical protein